MKPFLKSFAFSALIGFLLILPFVTLEVIFHCAINAALARSGAIIIRRPRHRPDGESELITPGGGAG